jgi:Xaa-Pro aminopeptidase
MQEMITPKALVDEKRFPKFSTKERDWRWNRVREGMRREGIDCLVIVGSSARWNEMNGNIRYLTNFGDKLSTTHYLVFPLEGNPMLLLQMSIKPSTQALSWVEEVRAHASANYGQLIVEKLKWLKLQRGFIGLVGMDHFTMLPHNVYNTMVSELPGARFEDKTDFYTEFQMLYSDEQILFMRKAAEIGNKGFEAELGAIKPGAKEYEIHAAIAYAMELNEGESPMLVLMNSGPMSGVYPTQVDPYPSGRVLKSGDIMLSEISAKYGGYYAQSQHTVTLGNPTHEVKELARIALEIYERAVGALKPGITSEDLKNIGEPIFKKYGLIHNSPIMHGAGFYAGGYGDPYSTRLRIGKILEVKENMIFVIEINPCTPDQSKGVFLGNTILVTRDGNECLHGKPPELVAM